MGICGTYSDLALEDLTALDGAIGGGDDRAAAHMVSICWEYTDMRNIHKTIDLAQDKGLVGEVCMSSAYAEQPLRICLLAATCSPAVTLPENLVSICRAHLELNTYQDAGRWPEQRYGLRI